MLQSYCLKQPSAKSGIKIHSRLPKHIHTPVFKTAPWPAHTTFSSSPSRTMLELSEWEGAIYGDTGTENCTEVLQHNQKCYTTTVCTQRALLQHHRVETVPWGRKPATALCLPSVDQRRSMPGREENSMMKGEKRNDHTNAPQFQEKSKTRRGEFKQPKRRQKNCPSSSSWLPQLPTFAFFKSQSQEAFPFFHKSSRTSFTAHIATSFFINRDSGLKASEARYNCDSLGKISKLSTHT